MTYKNVESVKESEILQDFGAPDPTLTIFFKEKFYIKVSHHMPLPNQYVICHYFTSILILKYVCVYIEG